MADVLITAAASPVPPAIARNGGSDFVVVWNDVGGATISGRIIRATGAAPIAPEFPVTTTRQGAHSFPAAAAGILDGEPGFVVVWLAETTATADAPGRNVMLQRFGSDGRRVDEEIRVSETAADLGHPPAVARLPDLNFVVTWVSADLAEGVRARVLRPDGAALGPDFRVNTSDGVHFGPLALSALANNSFVIAWQGGPNFGSTRPHLQIFEPTGSKAGDEKRPNFVGFTGDMAVAQIINPSPTGPQGRFAMARNSTAGGGEERMVVATTFTSDGDIEDGSFNITHRDDQSIGRDIAVAPLPSGAFVVAWTDRKVPRVGDPSGDNVKAMPCSGIQPLLSAPVQVSSATSGDQRSSSVAVSVDELGETRTAFAWVDDSVSGPGSSNRAIQARVLSGGMLSP